MPRKKAVKEVVMVCPVCGQDASGPVAASVAEVMARHAAKTGHKQE